MTTDTKIRYAPIQGPKEEVLVIHKKPVMIEAVQYTGRNLEEINCFAGAAVVLESGVLFVRTLENRRLEVDQGDWIIRDIKGDFYRCKQAIFAATYEAIE